MKRIAVFGAALLLSSILLSGCGGKKVAARVDKDVITEEEFQRTAQDVDAVELQNSFTRGGPGKAGDYAMQELIVDRLINEIAAEKKAAPSTTQVNDYVTFVKAFPQLAAQMGLPIDPLRSDASLRGEVRRTLALTNVAKQPLNITDADLQRLYDQQKTALAQLTPDQYHLRVIDTATPQKAQKALDALKKGVAFETVAVTESDNPQTKAKGGDIGVVRASQLPPVMLNAVKNLAAGQYTPQPIKVAMQGPTGQAVPHYLLIQVVEKIPGRTPSLQEVRPFLETAVIAQKDPTAGMRVQQMVRDRAQKANIQINLKQYQDIAAKLKSAPAPAAPVAPAP